MKATFEDAKLACKQLEDKNHESFLAGGCVRDILLGVSPSDFDVTTSATPEEVQKICGHSVPVGISFGVVKVICGENRELDVATFRTDGKYSDARRPDSVQYTKSAEEDVKRRDFTINALLMTADGKIIDYVGGQEDLKNKLLRTVGDPCARFAEDALRMMRAIRFSVKYNFDIDRDTWDAIKTWNSNIKQISKERVTDELIKMMTGGKADKAFWSLNACGLWGRYFGADHFRSSGNWDVMHALNMVEADSNFALPLAIILEPIYESNRIDFKNKLSLTTAHSTLSGDIINKSMSLTRFSRADLATQRRMMHDPDLEICKQFLRCKQLERAWEYDYHSDSSLSCVMSSMAEITAMGYPDPVINGNDLIEWKYVPGDVFSKMLNSVETEQLEGRVLSKDQARQYLLDKYRAAPRTLDDGTVYNGMAYAVYAAQCKSCRNTMSFEVAHKPTGEIDWSTIRNPINTSVHMNYYAECKFEINSNGGYYNRYCTGKKAKHKFTRMVV